MTPEADRLLKEALQLPPEARAALAGSLIDSLDEAVDPDAEQAWAAEIETIPRTRFRPRKAHPWSGPSQDC
jgi:hypothetical protein